MAISVNANTLVNNNTVLNTKTNMATNYVAKHAEQKPSAANLNSEGKSIARIMEGSDQDKQENDRLLRKMQLSKTRLDALGEYFGAIQTAKRGSGSNGFVMFRRVSNLANTQKEYRESDNHKNKKLTDTFVSDQVDALRELQEELLEEQARRAEENEQENVQNDSVQDETGQRDVSANARGSEKDKTAQTISASQSEKKQQAGAKVYQNSFANQKKGQTTVNWSSMI